MCPHEFIPCVLKQLPQEFWLSAAAHAIAINPANRAPVERLSSLEPNFTLKPEHLALLTTKYWGAQGVSLTVAFLDTNDDSLMSRILSHMNSWSQWGNVTFTLSHSHSADVRIARKQGDGYWSYLGTDIKSIPSNQPTMNLDSFSMDTPESEYHRVVRHEAGHCWGFIHEHMRRAIVEDLDVQKTIEYFERTQGWSEDEVRQQVLTPAEEATLSATPQSDRNSIMCYQLPSSITKSGNPIPGGSDIDEMDQQLLAKLYPKQGGPPPKPPKPSSKLFSLTFKRNVPQGSRVVFNAKTAIPAGTYDVVPSGGAVTQTLDTEEYEAY